MKRSIIAYGLFVIAFIVFLFYINSFEPRTSSSTIKGLGIMIFVLALSAIRQITPSRRYERRGRQLPVTQEYLEGTYNRNLPAIDKELFTKQLLITQEYCRIQMEGDEKDNAKIFRSFNPVVDRKPLFDFKPETFEFSNVTNANPVNHYFSTEWSIDPLSNSLSDFINNLFYQQIEHKKSLIKTDEVINYTGRILIANIDDTIIDGASEAVSLGLIDVYDMPPIDTWFYSEKESQGHYLYAWIPEEFVDFANEAIAVNAVDCINWYTNNYPEQSDKLGSSTIG